MIRWLKRLLGIRPRVVARRNGLRDLLKPQRCECGDPRCN